MSCVSLLQHKRSSFLKSFSFLVLLGFFLCLIGTPSSAVPQQIAYQGKLLDSTKAPLDGYYRIRFSLYTSAVSGSPVWSEEYAGSNKVKVDKGYFAVSLGSLVVLDPVLFSNALYLGVKVEDDPEMVPRVAMLAVPYAFEASRISGLDSSQLLRTDQNNTLYGKSYFQSDVYVASGKKVGLGVSAPQAILDVSGNAKISGQLSVLGTVSATRFVGDGSGLSNLPTRFTDLAGTLQIDKGGTGATNNVAARANLGLGVIATKNSINLSGNDVGGILPLYKGGTGASTPSAAREALSAAKSGDNSDITSLSALSTPLTAQQGGTGVNATSAADLMERLGILSKSGGTMSGPLIVPQNGFKTSGSTSQFVLANNSVGIGTSAPLGAYPLYVVGNVGVSGNINASGNIKAKSVTAAQFYGDGSGLTNVSVGSIAGVIPLSQGGTGANTAATARANLGLSDMAVQSSRNVMIKGGLIDGTSIGTVSPAMGSFSQLFVSGQAMFNGLKSGVLTVNDTGLIGTANVSISQGGTGSTTAAGARINLGLGSIATKNMIVLSGKDVSGLLPLSKINGIGKLASQNIITLNNNSDVTGVLQISNGGTGASDAAQARINLGLNQVENTPLSTWQGSTNVNTLGTIQVGTWNATTIGVNKGGTGATTVVGARASLGLGSIATKNVINLSGNDVIGITPIARGGTGASDAAQARINLGLNQVENTPLSTWQGSTNINTLGNITVGTWNATTIGLNKGGTGATSAVGARANLGLGVIATKNVINLSGNDVNGALPVGKVSGLGKFATQNIITLSSGDVAGILPVLNGGTGATNLMGYIRGNGVNAFTAGNLIPTKDISGVIGIASGGTGASDASQARINLGLNQVENTPLSTWQGSGNINTVGTITVGTWNATTISVNKGGTGATTVVGARANLGLGDVATKNTIGLSGNDVSGQLPLSKVNMMTLGAGGYVKAAQLMGTLSTVSSIPSKDISGVISIASGGTGASDASQARINLGLNQVENTPLSTWQGSGNINTVGTITVGTWNATTISVNKGGTGATTAAGARTNLGLGVIATKNTIVLSGNDVSGQLPLTKIAGLSKLATRNVVDLTTDVSGSLPANKVTGLGKLATQNAVNLTTDVTGTLPITSGGTGATTTSSVRANLGLRVGTDVQAYSGLLKSFADVNMTAADTMIYSAAANAQALTTLTPKARSFLALTSTADMKTFLGNPSAIFQSGSNVGIGTTAPDATFHIISGQAQFRFDQDALSMYANAPDHYPLISWNTGGNRGAYLGWGHPGQYIELELEQGNNFIINGGKVGIGNFNPSTALDVNGTITSTGLNSGSIQSQSLASGGYVKAAQVMGSLGVVSTIPTKDISGVMGIAAGGTGATDAAGARSNLGLVIGTNVQAYNGSLASIAGLNAVADKMIYATAAEMYALTDLTPKARGLLALTTTANMKAFLGASTVDAATSLTGIVPLSNGGTGASTTANARANLGLRVGTDVQAYNGLLKSFADVNMTAADTMIYSAAANSQALTTLTPKARSFLALNSTANMKTFLGAGTVDATTGILGVVPVANGGTGSGTALTAGSVVFAGFGGVYSQNNGGLFWDNSNVRLGIGTTTPSQKLEVNGKYAQTGAGGTAGDVNVGADGFYSYNGPSQFIRFNANGGAHDFLSAGSPLVINWSDGFGGYPVNVPQNVEFFGANATNTPTVFINGNVSMGGGSFDNNGGASARTFSLTAGSSQSSAPLVQVRSYGNSHTHFYVSGAGNVGIGTNSTGSDRLRVAGSASVTGNLNVSGNVVSSGGFSGPGINLTGLNASNISYGTLGVTTGGTGAVDAAGARSNLGLVIGTNVQAYNGSLASIAGLNAVADKMIYATAAEMYALTDLTPKARGFLALTTTANMKAFLGASTVDAATSLSGVVPLANGGTGASTSANARANLGLVIGTNVQAYNGLLKSFADVNMTAADTIIYSAAANSQALTSLTPKARSFLALSTTANMKAYLGASIVDASTSISGILPITNGGTGASSVSGARSNLGLGSIATKNTIVLSGDDVSGLLPLSKINGLSKLATRNVVDLATDTTGTLAISNGGTGATTTTNARANLGLRIGTDVQAYNGLLQSFAAVNMTAADTIIYSAAANSQALTTLTPKARSFLALTSTANMKTFLGAGTVDATTGILGIVPVANGGTGTSTAFTTGSVVFAGAGGVYSQNNAQLFWDTSNNRLGVGVTNPGAKLHVSGIDNESQIRLDDSNNNVTVRLSAGGGIYTPYMGTTTNHPFAFVVGNAHRLFIKTDGTIGIGTTTPASLLHLYKNGTAEKMRLEEGNSTYGNMIHFKSANNADGYIGQDGSGMANNTQDAMVMATWTNQPLIFFTNQTERMRVGTSGTVGIGTSVAPSSYKLFVNGAAGITTSLNVSGNIKTAGTVTFSSLKSGLLSVNGSGVVSTSTVTIAQGGTGTTTAFTQGSVVFAGASGVYSQNNSGLYFDSSGKRLGVGTNSISSTLHVNDSGTSWPLIAQFLAPNTTDGTLFKFGKDNTAKNSADFQFTYVGSGSNSNRIDFGFTNVGMLMSILAGGNVGVGNIAPASLFSVGNGSPFQVNSSGAIAAATGINSSGTIAFSGLSTNGYVKTSGGTGTLTSNATIPTSDINGVFGVTKGGTGATTTASARTVLGVAKSGANSDITSLSGLTTALTVAQGGTGTGTAMTQGSVHFAGASGAFSQDNSNFFWDNTNKRLGIGTSAPSSKVVVYDAASSVGVLKLLNGNNNAGDQWWIGFGHGSSGAAATSLDSNDRARIGVDIKAGGNGRLFFSTGAAGALGTRMFIDDAGLVGIGTTNPQRLMHLLGSTATVRLERSANTGYATTDYIPNGALSASNPLWVSGLYPNLGGWMLYSSDGTTNTFALYASTAGNIGIGTTTTTSAYKLRVAGSVGVTGNLNVSGNITLAGTVSGSFSGSGASLTNLNASNISSGTLAVANGGTGATTTANARTALGAAKSGANSDITSLNGLSTALTVAQGGTGTTTALTQGSVVFAGASGVYSQNNSGLFWDNTNGRLGLGTASPTSKLTVTPGGTPGSHVMAIDMNLTTHGGINFNQTAANSQAYFNFQESGVYKYQIGKNTDTSFFMYNAVSGHDFIREYSNGTLLLNPDAGSGSVGIGTSVPGAYLLRVAGDAGVSGLLNVSGNIKAAGTVALSALSTNGYVKTSGGTGTLSVSTSVPTSDINGVFGVAKGGTGTGTALTQGSVVFAGANGVYSQNNSGLNWTDASGTLTIQTTGASSSGLVLNPTNASYVNSVVYGNVTRAASSAFRLLDFRTNGVNTFIVDGTGSVIAGSWAGTAIPVAYGGTGSSTTANARTALGVAKSGANSDITSLSGLTTALSAAQGGTGTTTALTQGSIPFAGASGVYTQDNSNLFWDNTNKRLGIGTSTPEMTVSIKGSARIQGSGSAPYKNLVDSSFSALTLDGPVYSLHEGGWAINAINITPTFNASGFQAWATGINVNITNASSRSDYGYTRMAGIRIQPGTYAANHTPNSVFGVHATAPTMGGVSNTAIWGTNISLGASYELVTPPTNGAIIQGTVGIGTSAPGTAYALRVTGATGISGLLNVSGNITTAGSISGSFSGSGASLTNLNASNISSGTLAVANGGTGATTTANARTALGVAKSGANSDITSLSGLSTALTVAQGGTGTGTALTQGSVHFAGASGAFSQDNANFFWDNTNKRLGIGTTAPGSKLSVAGGVAIGSGTFANTAAPNNGLIVSGNVGIGTTNPSSKLTVDSGSIAITESANTVRAFTIQRSGSIMAQLDTTNGGFTLANPNTGEFYFNGISGTVIANIRNKGFALGYGTTISPLNGFIVSGNVGIGTTTPGSTLEVSQIGRGVDNYVRISNDYNRGKILSFIDGTSLWHIIKNPSSDDLAFNDTAGEKVRFQASTGRVGIGITNPSAKLHINSSSADGVAFRMNLPGGSYGTISQYTGTQYWQATSANMYVGPSTAHNLQFMTNNIERMRIDSTGKVSIVSGELLFTSPTWNGDPNTKNITVINDQARLYIRSIRNAAGGGLIGEISFSDYFSSADHWKSLILNSKGGNVGIGTTTPGQVLSVVGTIESTTGGFKFPDGTTQTTAAIGGGGYWATNGSNIYNNNAGSVGLGTSTPTNAKLHVGGGANIAGRFDSTAEAYSVSTYSSYDSYVPRGTVISISAQGNSVAGGALIDFNAYNSSNGASNIFLGAVAGSTNGPANFVIGRRTGTQTWAESVRIDTNGNMGIGTTTPLSAYKLLVSGAAGITGLLNVSGNITTAGTISGTFSGSGASLTSLSASNISSGTLAVARGGTGTGTAFTQGSVVFAGASGVYTQDNTGLFFDTTNDRLGIGTTTPGSNLSVAGGASIGSGYAGTAAPSNGTIIQGVVGIGTSAPGTAYAVRVAGAAGISGLLNVSGNITSAGTISGSFSGSGASLTNLNASNISSGTLAVANGGTGSTTTANARTMLGVAKSGANTDITSVYVNNTGLKIKDTDASNGLTIVPGSNLTADQTLTLTTGDASRTITLNGDPTLADWFDQSVKTTASTTFYNTVVSNILRPNSISNIGNYNSAFASPGSSGWSFTRNIGDENPAFRVIQQHASSTGPILQLENSSGVVVVTTQQGNVGIGTTSPASTLSVGSTSQFQVNGAGAITAVSMVASGRVTANAYSVTGGTDVAEYFDTKDPNIKPGMVMSIDPEHPGHLVLASKAYDSLVAGIVSGANGINPGILLQKPGNDTSKSLPIALAGRVWVMVDATDNEVKPGDMLTTSSTPGHAMKVMDRNLAEGAYIGKAMTALKKGQKGFVLVLVTLK